MTVQLLLPPLIETNFGMYYPSTAVLSGFLKAQGHRVGQRDLNEEFADYLLQPSHLEQLASGRVLGQPRSLRDPPCQAATLLLHGRDALFDERGRHDFHAESANMSGLLRRLAKTYLVDAPVSELVKDSFHRSPVAAFYRSFFETRLSAESMEPAPTLIGLSIPMGPQLGPTLILARLLGQRFPATKIVVGGPTISLMHHADLELILKTHGSIDAAVRFDGEIPLGRLAEQATDGRWEPTTVPGVCARRGEAVVQVPPERGPRLDDLPFSEFDPTIMGRLARPEIPIVQARGCYWGRCTYCDYVELYKGSAPYRTVTIDRFIDEAVYQSERHGVTEVAIITESIPPAFARKLSERIRTGGLPIRWNSFVMVDRRFTDELLTDMAEGGCARLCVGLETMNDRVLRLVDKSATREENLRFIRAAASAGIRLIVNLIPNLPSTTHDEAQAALAAVEQVQDCIARVSVFPFEPTRSSQIGRDPKRFGLRIVDDERTTGHQAQFASNHLEAHDPAMSPAELAEVIDAHRTLGARVNRRDARRLAPNLCVTASDLEDTSLHLSPSCVRAVIDDSVFCYNWVTEADSTLEQAWISLLARLEHMGTFTADDIRGMTPPAAHEQIFALLLSAGLLDRVPAAPVGAAL